MNHLQILKASKNSTLEGFFLSYHSYLVSILYKDTTPNLKWGIIEKSQQKHTVIF